jgi:argininosuccinate lyase
MREVLIRDGQRLCDAREALNYCPIGAVDLTTSGFAINRQCVVKLLGFAEPSRNSYAATTRVDYVAGICSAIKLLILHLGHV